MTNLYSELRKLTPKVTGGLVRMREETFKDAAVPAKYNVLMKKAIQLYRMVVLIFVIASLLPFTVSMNYVWGSEGAIKQVTLKVEGMTCASCPATVKAALKRLPGVVKVDVSFKEAKATTSYYEGKVTVEQMIKAIEDVGYYAGLLTGEKR